MSAQDALAEGYRPSGSLESFHRQSGADFALAAPPTLDCNTSPPGTLCFDYTYPDGGGHVVGYCDGNGTCQLYTKTAG
jgi:hypothetical protein